jgi:aspartate carbamoyltransferase catalytic subunit
MLDPSVENERIMKAEIQRELSNFDVALSFLSQPSRTRIEQVIEDLCKKCDPFVVNLTSYQTALEKLELAIVLQEMLERQEQEEKVKQKRAFARAKRESRENQVSINAGDKLAGALFVCLLLAGLLSSQG